MTTKANHLDDHPTEPDHKTPCGDLTGLSTQVTGLWASLKDFKTAIRSNMTMAISVMGTASAVLIAVFVYSQTQSSARTDKVGDTALEAKSLATVADVKITAMDKRFEERFKEMNRTLLRIENHQ
jgi:hypothetical protein